MDEKLLRFFKKIGYNNAIAFEDATFLNMEIDNKKKQWTINIKAPEVININSVMTLKNICKDGIDDVKKIDIHIYYDHIESDAVLEYFLYFLLCFL